VEGTSVGLLDHLWRRRKTACLAELLKAYPPYAAPFVGEPRSWTLAQANANLGYLMEHKDERIEALRQLLREFAIDVPSDLAIEDPQPLLDALHAWAMTEWRRVPASASDYSTWIASSRSGPDIVFSLLTDVAILFGEMVIARRPHYAWAIDLDPHSDMEGMLSFLRPVVQIGDGGPSCLDFEAYLVQVFFILQHYPPWSAPDHLGSFVASAMRGEYEPS
jgi:hypothetical protein